MENTNGSSLSSEVSELNLNDIYRQISVEDRVNFDQTNILSLISSNIEKCFDSTFLKIDSEILMRDENKLNLKFIELMKYCIANNQLKQVHYIFIGYCEYFDLDYNRCYLALHEKLQMLIKNGYISLVGKSAYRKIDNKVNPTKHLTIFDI